jgi:LacI family transcriptional regulator
MPRERFIGLALSHAFAYYRDILREIARFAETRPHWHFVYLCPEVDERHARGVLKHVDAAIVDIHSRRQCDLLLQMRVRTVNISDLVPDLPIPRVSVDNGAIARMAAGHFRERGLRSFGYVGQRHYLFSRERESVLRSWLKAAGHKLAVYNIEGSEYDLAPLSCIRFPDSGLGRWLSSLPRPAGLLTPCDLWAVEIMQVCREVKLRVPEDIAVLGVDDDDLCCAVARPPLSSIILPTAAIARHAAALVEQLIEGKKRRWTQDVLFPPPGIAVRRSTDVLAFDEPDVVAAIRFIRENCHRPIRVADVLKEVPVSRRWLERHILQALGMTLGAEIRRARLERAKRLLTQTDLSIGEIAAQSGFSDLRHLEVTFKQALGDTPMQFRRNAACA